MSGDGVLNPSPKEGPGKRDGGQERLVSNEYKGCCMMMSDARGGDFELRE